MLHIGVIQGLCRDFILMTEDEQDKKMTRRT